MEKSSAAWAVEDFVMWVCQLGVKPTGWDCILFGEHDYFHVVASHEDYVLHEGCNLGWGEALDDVLVVGIGVDTAAYVHVVNA